jgi:hypothetical protein
VSHQDPRSSREQGAGNVVNATPAALSLMRTMAPVSSSDPEALSAWATEAQGPAAFNVAMQSLSAMSGGMSVEKIMEKSRDDRRPEDLGQCVVRLLKPVLCTPSLPFVFWELL